MEYKCEKCGKTFVFTEEQEKNIIEFANRKAPYMVSRCPLCHSMLMLHPLSLMGITDELPDIEDNRLFYCPKSQCTGFVEYNNQNNIYECLDCGSFWETKQELYKSISEIVIKYSHRKEAYKKIKNGWKSIAIGTVSAKYYSKIQNDENDE
jgi:DNA-directed RNA polymerase subunit RPC12/RpoP